MRGSNTGVVNAVLIAAVVQRCIYLSEAVNK